MKQRILFPVLRGPARLLLTRRGRSRHRRRAPAPVDHRPASRTPRTRARPARRTSCADTRTQVGEVLRRDPSLMSRADYMAPYPQLAAFLAQHPEDSAQRRVLFRRLRLVAEPRSSIPSIEALGVLLGGMAGFFVLRRVPQRRHLAGARHHPASPLAQGLTGPGRRPHQADGAHDHQRGAARLRAESGGPPLPRGGADQAGGRRAGVSAPVGSIIWSMMAGIVLATVGVGFRCAGATSATTRSRRSWSSASSSSSLGIGFIVASLMAYLAVVAARPVPAATGTGIAVRPCVSSR